MDEKSVSQSQTLERKSPPGPRGHWLLGILPEVQKDPLGFLQSVTRDYGDIAKYRFAHIPSYLVNHPDYIKYILQDHNQNFNKQTLDYKILKPVVGEGLLTSDGEFWLRQRRLIQPAFHRQRIRGFEHLIVETTQEMLQRWHDLASHEPTVDIAEEMMQLTLRIVGKALFGQDVGDEAKVVGTAFSTLNVEITARFRTLLMPPLSWPTPRNRRFKAAVRELEQVVDGIIRRRREAMESGQAGPSEDLLTMLLHARDEETGTGMTDHQLRDEVMTLLLAGHETTANTLTWTWYLLSTHPEAAQRLRSELAQVLGGRLPTLEDIPNLPYTTLVIQESMRLYPPAWIISRGVIEDDRIGGYHIPAGASVTMSPYLVHRHPGFWEAADTFDPDRFTSQRSTGRPLYAYFPFGGGPRLCIGRDFAMLEAQLALATIAQSYHLELVTGQQVEPEPLVTLRPKHGILMKLCEEKM